MKKFSAILLVGLVFSVLAVSESSWAAKIFKDDDWTHSFYERCSSKGGFANGSEVKWMKEGDTKFLRFTLAGGQKGNCSRDKHRRKNQSSFPYWERSEITSGSNTRNKFRLKSGSHYKINLRVRFVEGFASNQESILQIYSECTWKGRCSPLLQMRSMGNYPPGYLRTEVLMKKGWKKKRGNWSSASTMNDYTQSRNPFTNDVNKRFSPITHKGKWINIIFVVSVTPKEVTLTSQVEAPAGVWTVPIQNIDIPPGMLDPHIEIGLYRPGSDTIPNPTSTIDFDYIKISKISEADYISEVNPFINKLYNYTDLGSLSSTLICYRHGLYDGRYIKEAKRRGLNCK